MIFKAWDDSGNVLYFRTVAGMRSHIRRNAGQFGKNCGYERLDAVEELRKLVALNNELGDLLNVQSEKLWKIAKLSKQS